MLCIRPFKVRPGQEFGCGQCLPCRINRRRLWTARIVLEAAYYGSAPSAFVTLTYRPEDVPRGETVVPAHLEEFRYRLRYAIGSFRYYAVGEYGERTQRPHYHVLLFGHFPSKEVLEHCWPYGGIHIGFLSVDSGAYCAGYVTKKMTSKDDPRLLARHPEFVRMSRKPGLGVPGLNGIIKWLYSSQGARYIQKYHDVPLCIRFAGKIYPLGRYLVGRLRDEFGIASSDPLRSLHAEAVRLERCLPEVMEAREFAREGHYQRAHFYKNLRRSKGVI